MTRTEKELMAKLAIINMRSREYTPSNVNNVIREIDANLTQSTFTAADLISVSALLLAGKGERGCTGPRKAP